MNAQECPSFTEYRRLSKIAAEARRSASQAAQRPRREGSKRSIICLEPAVNGVDPEPADPVREEDWWLKDQAATAAETVARAYLRALVSGAV